MAMASALRTATGHHAPCFRRPLAGRLRAIVEPPAEVASSSCSRRCSSSSSSRKGSSSDQPEDERMPSGGEDLYAVLGLPRGSGPDEIKAAYRRLVRECHPDVCPGGPAAAARFRQVSHAHTTLLHVGLRRMYDLHLRRVEGIENCRRREEERQSEGIAGVLRGRRHGPLGALLMGAGLGTLTAIALAVWFLALPGVFWTVFHRVPDWVPGKWRLLQLHSEAAAQAIARSRAAGNAGPSGAEQRPPEG